MAKPTDDASANNGKVFRSRKRRLVYAFTLAFMVLAVLAFPAPTGSQSCVLPPSGMVSWWPGEGDDRDIQGGNNGTDSGVMFVMGKVGRGFSFGGNVSLVVPQHPSLEPQRLTIDAWVRTERVTTGSTTGFIVTHSGRSGPVGYELGMLIRTDPTDPLMNPKGVLRFILNGGSQGADLIGSKSLLSDAANPVFHHVAATYDGQMMKIYVDGMLDGMKAVSMAISYRNARSFMIGAREDGLPWLGIIDEVEFYGKALTEAEIKSIFDAGSAGKCQCLDTTCPNDMEREALKGQCCAIVNYTKPKGTGCAPYTIECLPGTGTCFPVGRTTVTCTTTDERGNIVKTCAFGVIVSDAEPPAITCPPNITQGTGAGLCSAVVSYTATASDNCGGPFQPSCAPPSGMVFPLGVSAVNCTATDGTGRTRSCSFTITVIDNIPPTIRCPETITVDADSNCQATIPDMINFTQLSDNCVVSDFKQIPRAREPVGVGTYTINMAVFDAAMNMTICSTTLIVRDVTPPIIKCPLGTVATTLPFQTVPIPDMRARATATDCNSAGPVVISQVPEPNTRAGLGRYTITLTATDAAGNSASCTTPLLVTLKVGCDTPSFGAIRDFLIPGTMASPAAVADFNLDGKPDVVTSGGLGQLQVLFGKGDGDFGPFNDPVTGIPISAGGFLSSPIVVADFNVDGKPDIATGCSQCAEQIRGGVSVILGDGNGGFSPPRTFPAGNPPSFMAAADFNMDGKPDLVVSAPNEGVTASLAIMLGDGRGGLGPATFFPSPPDGAFRIVTGDFNNDKRPDVAALTGVEGSVFLGDGSGGLGPAIPFPTALLPRSIALVDINLDGNLDIATLGNPGFPFNPNLFITLGDGQGHFRDAGFIGRGVSFPAVGDFNLDGRPDFATTTDNTGDFRIISGSDFSVYDFSGAGIPFLGIVTGDFNVDGRPDLFISGRSVVPGIVSVLLNTCAARARTVCLQNENAGDIMRINIDTGDYEILSCHRLTFSGRGRVVIRGCIVTLEDRRPDGSIRAQVDTCEKNGAAAIRALSMGIISKIIRDSNIANNTCVCR